MASGFLRRARGLRAAIVDFYVVTICVIDQKLSVIVGLVQRGLKLERYR